MDNRIESFIKRAQNCYSSYKNYAYFVSDSEFFAVQNSEIFSDEKRIEYDRIWLDLEIINALMLENLDTCNIKTCEKIWDEKFRRDAREAIAEIIDFVKII